MRRNFRIGFQILLLLAARVSFGQEVDDTIRFIYEIWRVEQRRAIVQYFDLEESEKVSFWPIYNSYYSAIEQAELEYIEGVSMLARRSPNENLAKEVVNALLENELTIARYRKQFFRKFCRALPRAKAREFMTLDESMRMLFRLQLQKNSPLLRMSQEAVLHANERVLQ